MATNREHELGRTLYLPVPEGTESGDSVLVGGSGGLPGVALTDADDDDHATVALEGVFRLTVTGAADPGDPVYITAAGAVNRTDSNTKFGYILDEKTASAAVARVKIHP